MLICFIILDSSVSGWLQTSHLNLNHHQAAEGLRLWGSYSLHLVSTFENEGKHSAHLLGLLSGRD